MSLTVGRTPTFVTPTRVSPFGRCARVAYTPRFRAMMCSSGMRFAVGKRDFLPMPSPWRTVPSTEK